MSTKKKILLGFLGISFLVVVGFFSYPSGGRASQLMLANQEKAEVIIEALENFEQDYGHLPDKLEELMPVYISEIPLTTKKQEFGYELDDINGCYLCFYVDRAQDIGCCYYWRLQGWDCFYRYGE